MVSRADDRLRSESRSPPMMNPSNQALGSAVPGGLTQPNAAAPVAPPQGAFGRARMAKPIGAARRAIKEKRSQLWWMCLGIWILIVADPLRFPAYYGARFLLLVQLPLLAITLASALL